MPGTHKNPVGKASRAAKAYAKATGRKTRKRSGPKAKMTVGMPVLLGRKSASAKPKAKRKPAARRTRS